MSEVVFTGLELDTNRRVKERSQGNTEELSVVKGSG